MTEYNLLQEVKEDLERQRIEALWKRYGAWVVVLAILVVLGTAGMTAYRSWHGQREEKLTAALIKAEKPNDQAAVNIEALQQFANDNGRTDQAAFALLRAGALAMDQNDRKKAQGLFDQVASDNMIDPAFRQLGDLLSVEVQLDTGDIDALNARLDPLTAAEAPWRYSALQDQGYLAVRKNDVAKAKEIFTNLSQDARAPQSISARAADILRGLN